MTTTSTKVNFINNSSRKPKFYTVDKKLTTISKLKDGNSKSRCEMINNRENYTRYAIGRFRINKPELLIFEYLDVYRYGIVEFGGEGWKDLLKLTIFGCQIDFKRPYYLGDPKGLFPFL